MASIWFGNPPVMADPEPDDGISALLVRAARLARTTEIETANFVRAFEVLGTSRSYRYVFQKLPQPRVGRKPPEGDLQFGEFRERRRWSTTLTPAIAAVDYGEGRLLIRFGCLCWTRAAARSVGQSSLSLTVRLLPSRHRTAVEAAGLSWCMSDILEVGRFIPRPSFA